MSLTVVDQGLLGTYAQYTGFKNRIINGSMMIDQRNAGASVTPANGAVTYTLDRWAFFVNQASKLTTQQSSVAPAGFKNSLLVTSSSAYSVGSSDVFVLFQPIEGFNSSDLDFGTANAKTITVSFWVRSSLTGNFGGAISNSGNTRSYPFTFAINSANTWEQKSITIAGDTGGTWVGATNGVGLNLKISLGAGSIFSGTAGAWASADLTQPTGSTSVVGTNGATFYITGVQLEKGSTATSFDYRPYGTELALCQRYYQLTNISVGNAPLSTRYAAMFSWGTTMRATPTFGQNGVFAITDAATADYTQSSTAVTVYNATATGGYAYMDNFSGLTTTRLFFSRFSNANMVTLSAEL